jgi:hypothetical protein
MSTQVPTSKAMGPPFVERFCSAVAPARRVWSGPFYIRLEITRERGRLAKVLMHAHNGQQDRLSFRLMMPLLYVCDCGFTRDVGAIVN